jgi:hypothetical protein
MSLSDILSNFSLSKHIINRISTLENSVKLLKTLFAILHPKDRNKTIKNLPDDSDLFTGVLFNNYGPPNGFCFDIVCDDEPIIDDKYSPDYNVDRRVSFSSHFKTETDTKT